MLALLSVVGLAIIRLEARVPEKETLLPSTMILVLRYEISPLSITQSWATLSIVTLCWASTWVAMEPPRMMLVMVIVGLQITCKTSRFSPAPKPMVARSISRET
jgi:hypothetical protein